MSVLVTLDPLAPVREAFIRVLDHAQALQQLEQELPQLLRERATIGLVAVGMADLPTIQQSVQAIDETLRKHALALTIEPGKQCQAETTRIRELISNVHGTASD